MRLVTHERLDKFDAEHWIARWEREAEATGRERGSTGYWDEGWRWIERERDPPTNAEGDAGEVAMAEEHPRRVDPRRQRLRELLRAEWIAGAEEEWRRRTRREMTAAELERVLRRFPGDV